MDAREALALLEQMRGRVAEALGRPLTGEEEEAAMHEIEAAGDRAQAECDERRKHEARVAMEGGYENAPATRMLATRCAACARPLVDAASVEAGMGPDCREKYGAEPWVTEEARKEANALVYRIALDQRGPGVVAATERLRGLGFWKLADRILERCVAIEVREEGGALAVRSPFSEEALLLFRGIPGRRWDGERKVNVVPTAERRTLWQVLERAFPGAVGLGPKGAFVVPGGAREAA